MKLKLLGIDYGQARVGLSLATTPLAEPVKTIAATQAFDLISRMINEQGIDAVVIGVSEGESAQQARTFGQQITSKLDIPLYYQDETLSSQESAKKLVEGSASKSTRSGATDHFAATQILQDFIDAHLPLDELPEPATIEP